jgi:hypothetical protein
MSLPDATPVRSLDKVPATIHPYHPERNPKGEVEELALTVAL